MNFLYRIHGLLTGSDVELPGAKPDASDQRPDIAIRRGRIPSWNLEDVRRWGPYFHACGQNAWFLVPEVGRFYMERGQGIVYETLDETDALLLLLGTCMAVVLFQRGRLVLHGTAIGLGDRAVVCAGRSGAGKSTLAAAFMKRGYRVMGDDACAITPGAEVMPSYPRLQLWRDSADRLGLDVGGLERVRPGQEKFFFPLADGFASRALPATHIYILRSENVRVPVIAPIEGVQRLRPLCHHTYRMGFLEAMGLQGWHLQEVGRLANCVNVSRLARPQDSFSPDAIVDRILDDVAVGAGTTA